MTDILDHEPFDSGGDYHDEEDEKEESTIDLQDENDRNYP